MKNTFIKVRLLHCLLRTGAAVAVLAPVLLPGCCVIVGGAL